MMVRVISFEVVQLARMIANKEVRIYRIIIVIDKIDKTLCIYNLDGNGFVRTFAAYIYSLSCTSCKLSTFRCSAKE